MQLVIWIIDELTPTPDPLNHRVQHYCIIMTHVVQCGVSQNTIMLLCHTFTGDNNNPRHSLPALLLSPIRFLAKMHVIPFLWLGYWSFLPIRLEI